MRSCMLRLVASTVASRVLMDKAGAMNGGYRFLCVVTLQKNQTWQAGTSPCLKGDISSNGSFFHCHVSFWGCIYDSNWCKMFTVSINSIVIWSCGLLCTFLSTVIREQFTPPSLHLLCQRQLREHGNCIDFIHHMGPWKANHANLPGRPCTGKVAIIDVAVRNPKEQKGVKAHVNPKNWNLNMLFLVGFHA